jgi:Archaeal holliday junction resolvase (hjc)
MTPEAKVKKKVVDVLKKNNAYYFFPATGGYGRSGVPDIVCCYRGIFVAIECKAGSNKPTPLQEAEMQKIREAQGFVLVVNETNIEDVAILLRDIG